MCSEVSVPWWLTLFKFSLSHYINPCCWWKGAVLSPVPGCGGLPLSPFQQQHNVMGATSGCWYSWASARQAPAVLPSWWHTGGDGNRCVWTGRNICPFPYRGSMALVVFTCLCLGGEANRVGLEYRKWEGWKTKGVGWSKIIPKYKE